MSRRMPKSETGFGSDSFLDIIANIVGILIILIVISGLRVSHAPVPTEKDVAAGSASPDTAVSKSMLDPSTPTIDELPIPPEVVAKAPLPANIAAPQPIESPSFPQLSLPHPDETPFRQPISHPRDRITSLDDLPLISTEESKHQVVPPVNAQPSSVVVRPKRLLWRPKSKWYPDPQQLQREQTAGAPSWPTRLPPPRKPEPIPVSQDLIAAIDGTQQELQRLSRLIDATVQQQSVLDQKLVVSQNLAQVRHRKYKDVKQTVAVKSEFVTAQQQSIMTLEGQLQQLQRDIDAERNKRPKSVAGTIKHELNPIGRKVDGSEIHFRLSGGRVSYVPLPEMVGDLRDEVQQRVRWLAKFPEYTGKIGPIEGYAMEYLLKREGLSAIDRLQAGPGMVRISVAQWQIMPQSNLKTESAKEALRTTSRFAQMLRLADKETTVTLWVYPDSFELYSQLKDQIHAEGLTVAGRPLPAGMPISGSPDGSSSVGQ